MIETRDSSSAIAIPYYVGCPVWACSGWTGKVFRRDAKRTEWLHQYSGAFNTVEGNSTFYGLPSLETVRRWCRETLPGFRFALKFPRTISHERQLVNVRAETKAFLSVLEVLYAGDRLGTSFLQLPPGFSRINFPALATYLRELPTEFPFAVEVRHRDYFDQGPHESAFDELLQTLQIDRVLFDSRALFSGEATDEFEQQAQDRKPNSPFRTTVTATRPLVRFVGRNDVEQSHKWLNEWVPVVANWIRLGHTPYVFTHAPDDTFAPELAWRFHQELRKHLPSLPELPRLAQSDSLLPQRNRQLELF